uniref:Uncharacterized protein n=1 Tax=Eutreptiella gymnastica TaxID=73025 RepID=A0A7S1INU2_9EUGL|mmetsp:Transcript_31390/g.56405  ORF Transcript_31390/g.56405 Transcript_31390/m.56405 type:complete len:116 (+) Transcript_31390:186-533(+)
MYLLFTASQGLGLSFGALIGMEYLGGGGFPFLCQVAYTEFPPEEDPLPTIDTMSAYCHDFVGQLPVPRIILKSKQWSSTVHNPITLTILLRELHAGSWFWCPVLHPNLNCLPPSH